MSIYNRELDTLFIHNPKTAGTSMERIIGGGGHYPIWIYHRFVKGLDDVFKFGFVRHPLDRFVSAFFHQPNVVGVEHNQEGFNKFVEKIKDKSLNPKKDYPHLSGWTIHHHFLPQWFFLCDFKTKEVAVDFVGRFEHLERDWGKVCDTVGVDDRLAHLRTTDHKHYKEYYTPETEKMVRQLYKEDFEIFNYG